MITFRTISYKNFLSTGNTWNEIHLDQDPLTLIVGANGAGKSTILDAICFALFGRPFRKFNKTDVVNSINKKECEVHLFFHTPQHQYWITRGVAPAKFEICRDNQDMEIGGKDAQAVLEGILGFNYKTFTQVAILGASSFVPFMKLQAADRRALIEDLLDQVFFSAMNALVKTRLNLYASSVIQAEKDISGFESTIKTLKKADAEGKADHKLTMHDSLVAIATAQIEIKVLKGKIFEAQNGIEQDAPLRTKLKELQVLKYQIDGKLATITKNSKFFVDNEDCPTCKQEITTTFREKEIENGKVKIAEYTEGLKLIGEKIQTIEKTLKGIEEKNRVVAHLQFDLKIKQAAEATASVTYAKAEKKLNESSGMSTLIINEEAKLTERQVELAQVRDLQRYHNSVAGMLKDTGIKAKIIQQYLPVINKTVNEYLKAMDFFVQIEFDDQFNEVIKSRHRDKFTYEHFSEGERKRIDLALLLTWRAIAKMKARMDTNLLILDEVFDSSLDEVGIDGFMSILESWENRNVFIISHKGDQLADKFNNVIKFEKQDNFSRITE